MDLFTANTEGDYERESLGFKLRKKRFGLILSMIQKVYEEKGSVSIIDIGGETAYWRIAGTALEDYNVSVVMINLEHQEVPDDYGGRLVSKVGNACDLVDVGDYEYDIAHSNSVIEHVGLWPDMVKMASEVRRVASKYYLQVPYFWFPIEPHFHCPFIHWLPGQWQARIHMKFNLGFSPKSKNIGTAMQKVQSAMLLDRSQLSFLMPDAELKSEKFAFFIKSLIAIRA